MASHSISTIKCKENTGMPACAQLAFSVLTQVRIHCLGNGATRKGQVLTTSVNIVMAIPYRTTWSRQSLTEMPSSGNSKLCQVDYSDQPSISLPHCLNSCLAQIDSPSTYIPPPEPSFLLGHFIHVLSFITQAVALQCEQTWGLPSISYLKVSTVACWFHLLPLLSGLLSVPLISLCAFPQGPTILTTIALQSILTSR